ncbi:MAG: hypothetical protein ABII07_02715 [Patescibacteria group bacterium]|nr:hypothetical protein [Patescibacteria group bacterium]
MNNNLETTRLLPALVALMTVAGSAQADQRERLQAMNGETVLQQAYQARLSQRVSDRDGVCRLAEEDLDWNDDAGARKIYWDVADCVNGAKNAGEDFDPNPIWMAVEESNDSCGLDSREFTVRMAQVLRGAAVSRGYDKCLHESAAMMRRKVEIEADGVTRQHLIERGIASRQSQIDKPRR